MASTLRKPQRTKLNITIVICVMIVLIVALLAGGAMAMWYRSFSAGGTSTCRGERATDTVQAGETWHGSEERDVVVATGNGTQLFANGGNDLICVYGNDAVDDTGYSGSTIFGGTGNNTVITYGGNNSITTDSGNDLIYLNGGEESVTAQDGDDHIWALGTTKATIYGGGGNDLIIGGAGDDYLVGGSNDDVVLGNGGDDEIIGLYGANKLYGGSGHDTIDGGADFDFCQDHDQDTIFTHCEDISQPLNPPLPESS